MKKLDTFEWILMLIIAVVFILGVVVAIDRGANQQAMNTASHLISALV